MPSLMLRDLPPDVIEDIRANARAWNVPLPVAAEALLRIGLEQVTTDPSHVLERALEILAKLPGPKR